MAKDYLKTQNPALNDRIKKIEDDIQGIMADMTTLLGLIVHMKTFEKEMKDVKARLLTLEKAMFMNTRMRG